MKKKKILFLCTGNYYRSKFAEIYFNYFATKNNLNWEASSRGFHVQNPDNIGWISQLALKKLKDLKIPVIEGEPPRSVALVDLKRSDVLIILNKKEHCPFVKKAFPEWENKFIYWHIFDRQEVAPELALMELQKNIDSLISNLKLE